jgi:hypothetical protein
LIYSQANNASMKTNSLKSQTVMLRRQTNALVILSICASLACGCGDGRPKRVPVSGKVLIDGEPLKFGAVVFAPETGRASTGPLDANGHFSLTCYTQNDGALLGKHRVQVLGTEQVDVTTARVHAPKKYAALETSGLSEEITGPTDSLVINLTWKGNVPDKPYTENMGPAGEDFKAIQKKNARNN